MTRPIPILPYDKHISKALDLLNELGDGGIDQLRWAMSVLIYRLSKILCASDAPNQPVGELLEADLNAALDTPEFVELKAHEASLRRAIGLLKQLLQYAGWYSVDRVVQRVIPNFTDNIAPHQNPATQQTNKPYSSWGRPLPFRPLFCALGIFALAFPVRADAKKYEKPPGEDSPNYQGGDDKPKVRLDKQRTFATLLDACDYQVAHWKSHFKSEPSYDGQRNPLMSEPAQRPRRKGNCYWRKERGSLSPDIVIVKIRRQAPDLSNVTHAVDMKFGGDDLGFSQGQAYANLFGATRLYVLYFPDDCQKGEPEERSEPQPEWVELFLGLLLLLLTRGRVRGRIPGRIPVPVPAH